MEQRSRRQPKQSRSREMVDSILEGAVRAFTSGRGEASINRIAEIAGVSIGSVYQYFPGKSAVVGAVIRKRMRDIHERLLGVIEESVELSLEEGAARFVDAAFTMKLAQAESDAAILREALRHSLTEDAFALDAELVERFAEALERWKPRVRADLASEHAAHMLFHGLRAVMVTGAIARPDLATDDRMRAEMQRLIVAYLT